MIRRLGLVLLVVLLTACALRIEVRRPQPQPRAAVTYVASPTGNDAAGTPCTDAQPCSVRRGLLTMSCSNNDVLELLGTGAGDGVYRGANYMLNLAGAVPAKAGTDSTHQCTVKARNDGGVFIDGQFARNPWETDRNDWWTFQGFDVGNASDWGASIWRSNHVTVKRVCASNVAPSVTATTNHVWLLEDSSDGIYEDICGFGTGRNTLMTHCWAGLSLRNRFTRVWLRWEGNDEKGSMTFQPDYYQPCDPGPTGTSGNDIYENMIVTYSGEQTPTRTGNITPGMFSRWWHASIQRKGLIFYGVAGAPSAGMEPWFAESNANWVSVLADIFVDGRTQAVSTFNIGCASGGEGYDATKCAADSGDRLTAIRHASASPASFGLWPNLTNYNECTSLVACPNFYTGDTSGSAPFGSRSCQEYLSGSLTATKLWPWRMDDRIKAARARANAAGTGGAALLGGAGSGYAAGTVTSEIVSLYGAIPSACNRSGAAFVPSFPVVTDFPSTPILDTFNRANGALGANWITTLNPGTPFTVVSNQAKAPALAFARHQWAGGTFAAAHEVYQTLVAPSPVGHNTVLVFAGTAGTDTGQYRLYMDRYASANTTLQVDKFDATGAYAGTVLGPIDLGTDFSEPNQLLGVRVSSLQTISLYWKYTDGNTYRVGSVIDASLPPANTAIGFAGNDTAIIDQFGGGTCCGGASAPGNVGRFGNRFPAQ